MGTTAQRWKPESCACPADARPSGGGRASAWLVGWLLCGVAAGGCDDLQLQEAVRPADASVLELVDASALRGRSFVFDSSLDWTPAAGTYLVLRFEDEGGAARLTFYAGCAGYSGIYTVDAGQLVVPTLKEHYEEKCSSARSNQDTFLVSFLESQPSIHVDAGRLELRGERLALTLVDLQATDGAPSLLNRTYQWVSSEGFEPVPESPPRVNFREQDGETELGLSAGCNGVWGRYVVHGGRLLLLGLGSTQRACGNPLSGQEHFVTEFLSFGPELKIEGDGFELRHESGGKLVTMRFVDREVADPDRPLTGRLWTIDTLIESGLMIAGSAVEWPTVQFGEDGTVDVSTACNTGSGMFERAGDTLTLSAMQYTGEACSDAGLRPAGSQVEAVLSDGDLQLEIDAAQLTLIRGDLGLGARTD